HFPDEAALFGACSAHYFTANPWPDLGPWLEISDPQQRLQRALGDLYAYYERTEPMLSNVFRDLHLVDALSATIVPLRGYLTEPAELLAATWPARGRRRRVLDAALRHAIDFRTWHSLTAGHGITRAEAVQLAGALVHAAAAPQRRRAA